MARLSLRELERRLDKLEERFKPNPSYHVIRLEHPCYGAEDDATKEEQDSEKEEAQASYEKEHGVIAPGDTVLFIQIHLPLWARDSPDE